MMQFGTESFSAILPELKPLFAQHWAEIGPKRDVAPFDMDYARYARMEEIGVLATFTARDDGALVGYSVYFVSTHINYQRDVYAFLNGMWLSPKYRKGWNGVWFVRFVENELRGSGVSVMHSTARDGHPALSAVLEYLGHAHVERGYVKLLKEAP